MRNTIYLGHQKTASTVEEPCIEYLETGIKFSWPGVNGEDGGVGLCGTKEGTGNSRCVEESRSFSRVVGRQCQGVLESHAGAFVFAFEAVGRRNDR